MQTAVISIFIYVGNVYFFNKVSLISKNSVFFLSPSLFLSFYVSPSMFCLSISHNFLKWVEYQQ